MRASCLYMCGSEILIRSDVALRPRMMMTSLGSCLVLCAHTLNELCTMADDSQSRKVTQDDLRRMMAGVQMKDESKSADHKFWDTQPVPKLGAQSICSSERVRVRAASSQFI